jgi:conjugative transposon TraN protein
MKKSIILLLLLTIKLAVFGQPGKSVKKINLPTIVIDNNISVHFISPDPIKYVDISTKTIVGDLPVDNVLRIKHQLPKQPRPDSINKLAKGKKLESINYLQQSVTDLTDDATPAVITIVTQKYYAQYRVVYNPDAKEGELRSSIEIVPQETKPLDISGSGLTQNEMRKYALSLFENKPKIFGVKASNYKLQGNLNNIYTLDDYIFLDVTWKNATNLRYDIDQIRFKIEDKKMTKSTNVQSLEIKPDFILNDSKMFKRAFRNIYVFKKFTFPGDKVFNIEITEKQVSGRNLSLLVDYSDLLQADTIVK